MDHGVFNKAVFQLWNDHFNNDEDIYVPLILPPLVCKGLLFIGNNPSFSLQGFSQFLLDTEFSTIDPHSFFHWKNRHLLDMEAVIKIERHAKDRYRYFNKFRDISVSAKLEWEHIDLFFFREKNQNKFIKERVLNNRDDLTRFAREQLSLSKRLVETVDPKIIVVANAFASDIFIKEFDSDFDEALGYHLTPVNNRLVPTFLGSMLTGQRAMDRYSYQRLKWHIVRVARQLKR